VNARLFLGQLGDRDDQQDVLIQECSAVSTKADICGISKSSFKMKLTNAVVAKNQSNLRQGKW